MSASTAQPAHAVIFHTLVACISQAEHFFALPAISRDLPTRTLLLAATLPLDPRYPPAVDALSALSSLAIVCCAPASQSVGPPDGGGRTLFSLVSRLVHGPSLARMSLALRSSRAMDLSALDLSAHGSLAQLRLILHSPDMHVSSSFTLPSSLAQLAVSAAVLLKISSLAVPRLTRFSLCEPDASDLTWPGDHGYTFPPPNYTSPVPMGSALDSFLSTNQSITSLTLTDIGVTSQMLQTLTLLPSLLELSLHPASWYISDLDDNVLRRAPGRYGDEDGVCVFAESILPNLINLRFLHVGEGVRPRLGGSAMLTWATLVTLAPPSVQAIARGRCLALATRHFDLRGTCPRGDDDFSWANNELKAMSFRFYD